MRRRLAAILVTAALAGCGGDDDGGVTWEGTAGQPVPASFDEWVPVVNATAGGAARAVLLDSGAPLTLVDTGGFGVEAGGQEIDLAIGDLRFPALPVVADEVFPDDQPLDGIVGGDVLTTFAYSLDYKDERIWLEDDPGALPDGAAAGDLGDAVEIGARITGGGYFLVPGGDPRSVGATRFLVHAEVEDLAGDDGFWVLVDTGASSVVLSNELAGALGDDGRPRLDGVTVNTVYGPMSAYFTRVWSLRLGDAGEAPAVDLGSVPALVLPEDSLFESLRAEVGEDVRAIVGGTYLRWFLTTLDYPHDRLRLQPYLEADHIDPDEFISVGFTIEPGSGGGWQVDAVVPGSDAEAEGLATGEVVRTLGGTDVTGASRDEVDALLVGYPLGDEVPVGVVRGVDVVELQIAVEDLLPEFEGP